MRGAWWVTCSVLAVLAYGCAKPAEPPPSDTTTAPSNDPATTTPETTPAEPTEAAKATAADVLALPTDGLQGKQWVIGHSQCNRGEPWRVQMDADIEAAAAKYPDNIELIMRDAQNDAKKQGDQVREFITQGVDLLIISPKEARPLTQPVEEAMDAGIPVIVLDRAIESDKYTCFIGADNVKIGEAAGRWLAEALGGKGKVVELMGLQTSTPGQDRHNGFMKGIEGSDIEIVFSADCKWLEDQAKKEMASALTTNDEIDAVYGHNDPSAHGAYTAAEQEGKGREQTIKFVGIDALPHEGQKYVKEGMLAATFLYPTGGDLAIEAAIRILLGQEVPRDVVLGTKLFTPENIAAGGQDLT